MKVKTMVMLFIIFAFHPVYGQTVFIFNPEAKAGDLKKVKTAIKSYLGSQGVKSDIYFFANPVDFEDSVPRLKPACAIVASYYFTLMKDKFHWQPALSGHYKGKKEFSKVLVTLKSITQLKNKSLAAVSLGASSLPYIDSQLPKGLTTKSLRVVSVSKDIDAIMALGFEQVQAAIVTEASFKKLESINPEASKNLHLIQKLSSIQYPKLAVFPKIQGSNKLKAAFKNIPYKGSARKILRFFSITGFVEE
ncbi:MAG: phosphate/phosphite/phosphonate ABC transporter substrate-binding protein [Desulfobacterales bacterium]|nr:phosphate/phosphite/phosphonate ABC transporter substrate-binding protein [Desulfobacterales bacterium]